MIINVYVSCCVFPSVFKPSETVLRIRLKYGGSDLANLRYTTFTSGMSAKTVLEAVHQLLLRHGNFTTELIRLGSEADMQNDYHPSVIGDVEERSPKARHPPTPYRFVAYYREGLGRFIHAAKYLEKVTGSFPMKNIKKYANYDTGKRFNSGDDVPPSTMDL